jgi:putative hydrolase of the HAD superfamily
MVQAILFDLGDTLLDFRPLDTKSIAEQGVRDTYQHLQQAGLKLPSMRRYHSGSLWAVRRGLVWSRIRGGEMNVYELIRRRAVKLGAPDNDQFMLDLAWRWYKPVLAYSSIETDLIATLDLFRNAGLKMGIVSNTFIGGPQLDRHLQEMGLKDYFPVRIYSSDVNYRKPHRRIFEVALKAIGTSPNQTLFVGDMVKTDIVGATRMGMTTVLKQPWSTARQHYMAKHVIRRISELVPIVLPAAEVAATRA